MRRHWRAHCVLRLPPLLSCIAVSSDELQPFRCCMPLALGPQGRRLMKMPRPWLRLLHAGWLHGLV